MFGKFNKFVISDTFLNDPKFDIAIINLKKTYNIFITKFILAIILPNFINQYKISNFWWTFNEQF